MRVLVIEDGEEHIGRLRRFLPDGFHWRRAGDAGEALAALAQEPFDALYLDMCFDRVPAERLLGHEGVDADPTRTRQLQAEQGLHILAALRRAGHALPVLVAHDLGRRSPRWARIQAAHAPVDFVDDTDTPADVARRLRALGEAPRR